VRRAYRGLTRVPPTDRQAQHEPPPPGTRLECKICWQVYDPAVGDLLVWQIPPGTPFTALPAHWTCPNCSATKDQFLVLADD
jgi:rubredoxin